MEKRIRRIELADAEAVRDIYAPFVSDSATSFEVEPPDVATMERRIRDLQDQNPWLVFEANGRVLGYAYASSHRPRKAYQWSVEVLVYLHDSARQCGVGRALYLSLFEVLRRQGYVNAYAGITLPNPASVGLHESLGFAALALSSVARITWLRLHRMRSGFRLPQPISSTPVLDGVDYKPARRHDVA